MLDIVLSIFSSLALFIAGEKIVDPLVLPFRLMLGHQSVRPLAALVSVQELTDLIIDKLDTVGVISSSAAIQTTV